MTIWFKKDLALEHFSHWGENTMTSHIGLEFTELGENYLMAKMPVDHRTIQPYGLLHGGASVVLAETLGSVASALVIDHDNYISLGIEINANHVRSARKGYVYGKCLPLHLGSSIHIWEIKITDENEKLICVSRLTVAIKKRGITKNLNDPE
ncbi:MAG: hotdog fold thioesterase [Bacteroidetes bacterium]|jgi:1,4-dihydroxy-2-naphthoyl-CoA hydrolase|nr:hotdog fold thioesterase [Bacteroidota bacterium]MBK7568794.1 hotdog fold thioesterase [Bacteroidota bacterium]MBP8917446.1 hotdog fold thioesterase [Chitinophagales bacterium]